MDLFRAHDWAVDPQSGRLVRVSRRGAHRVEVGAFQENVDGRSQGPRVRREADLRHGVARHRSDVERIA